MTVSPLEFFSHLAWIDGKPLLDVIEPYRRDIFTKALYTLDGDYPRYNLALCGRGKKNWKSADLIFAALYRLLAWNSPQGNDCFLLANDEGQALDDLKLCKKIITCNPILSREVSVKQKTIERTDGRGELAILPAKDIVGQHGKTYLFIGYDEIHGYRNWDVLEALAPDPTRLDAMTWITSYASIYHYSGAPLHDLFQMGKQGNDPRMFFSWYASDFTTDPAFEDVDPEVRANPSLDSWNNPGYLTQQKRRLPTHKYRRLHLNLPGMPDGTYFDADSVLGCVVEGRKRLKPQQGVHYFAFVDMSGGSSDDATLAVAHRDDNVVVLDLIEKQAGKPPFNPRDAVRKFAALCKEYRVSRIVGDRYAGQTFRSDFEEQCIRYDVSDLTKHQIYEALEPKINAGEVQLLDVPKLQEQLLGLVIRNRKIDHLPGEHDDLINAAAGAIQLCVKCKPLTEKAELYERDEQVLEDAWQSFQARHEPGSFIDDERGTTDPAVID